MRKGKFTHKLLQKFELVNLHTGKLVFRLRRVKMHFGRKSLLLRDPFFGIVSIMKQGV